MMSGMVGMGETMTDLLALEAVPCEDVDEKTHRV